MNTIDRLRDELNWREMLDIPKPTFIQAGSEAFEDLKSNRLHVSYNRNAPCPYSIFGIPFCESEYCKPLQLRYMDYAGHCVEELKSSAKYGNKEAFYLIQRLHELAAEVAGVK